MLEPTGEETGMGQLVDLVQVAKPWPAAAVAAHSSVHLSFLVAPSCFLLPDPNHHTAAVEDFRTAAAGIGTGEVGSLLV